ncbi:MAG: retropepsin-like domain-containing protein [Thermoplasmatales archaeon]|nr:retropepsin-like domain-containing protein [Thermoplasmatales archaeon]MCW6170373.1 retropepsin-like domain-containing protein [Thermoplasmatales archaeon]
MGLLTLSPMGFKTASDPNDPKKIHFQWNPSLGASVLAQSGIILNVAISPDMPTASTLQTQGVQTPQPFLCKALVDTGASGLAIDKTIASTLGLKKKGITNNLTANGAKISPVYFVSLSFPGSNLKNYDILRATEVDLANQPFHCLIGRETMSNWHMHYNGQTGQISISD